MIDSSQSSSSSSSSSPAAAAASSTTPPLSSSTAKWLSPPLRHCYTSLTKNKQLIGTFDDKSFQLQLIPPSAIPQSTITTTISDSKETKGISSSSLSNSDALSCGVFDMIGCPCIPLIGSYGDNYDPLLPYVIISVPTHGTHTP
jgi:hypothetical protein